jgi:hypothetical protein
LRAECTSLLFNTGKPAKKRSLTCFSDKYFFKQIV